MKIPKYIFIIIVTLLLQSCAKDVDFDQIDDASIETSYKATLVYFDLEPIKFLDDYNQEIIWTSDYVAANINDASRDYLERVEFTVVTENSFDRSFVIQVIFYDENGSPIYQLNPSIYIEANSGKTTTIIEIPQTEIDIVYSAKYFGFSITMSNSGDGTVLSGDEDYKLNLQSSVELFFNFRKI